MTKRCLLITLFLIISYSTLFSQNVITYTYDSNGNRVSRKLTVIELKSGVTKKANDTDSSRVILTSEKYIKIFPNPVKSELTIKIVGYDDGVQKNATIYDMDGRMLIKTNSLSSEGPLDLNALQDGVYILIIKVGDEVSRYKIIKSK
jgi:hypothetical protein